jgi:hypothetical protein
MQRISLRELVKPAGISSMSAIRVSQEGHPFVTFLSKDGKAQNVWLSQNAAKVANVEGMKLNMQQKETASIVNTINAKGEQRFKLSFDNVEYDDLLADFGFEEVADFDVKLFTEGFKAAPNSVERTLVVNADQEA